MKNILLGIVILITQFAFPQITSGKITYKKVKSQVFDSLLISEQTHTQLQKTLIKTSNYINNFSYELRFKDNHAVYKKVKSIEDDKLGIRLAKALSGFQGKAYYDLSKNEIIVKTEFAGKLYDIKSYSDSFNWNLTTDKKKIGKYMCYKAISKEVVENKSGKTYIDIIAWYTPEIPLSFGPDGYSGLPGLILEIQRNNIITYANKFEFIDDIKLDNLKINNLVTQDEFNNIAKKLNQSRKQFFEKN